MLWHALVRPPPQVAHLITGAGNARYWQSPAVKFGAFMDPGNPDWDAMLALLGPGDMFAIRPSVSLPASGRIRPVMRNVEVLEYAYSGPTPSHSIVIPAEFEGVRLSDENLSEINELASSPYTQALDAALLSLGPVLGWRERATNGRLVAIAGARLAPDGFGEISTVVTRQSYTGRGYATFLVNRLIADLLASDRTPYLYVNGANSRAIALYEHLGFTRTRTLEADLLEFLG